MPPLAIITGILLGSCTAIGGGLLIVLFLFFLLADDYPRLAAEYGSVVTSTAIFLTMTVICAFSFVGLVRRRSWRWVAQAVMWTGVVFTVLYYLPDG